MDLNEFCINHYKKIIQKEKRRIYNKKYKENNKDKIHKQKTISRWKNKFNCEDYDKLYKKYINDKQRQKDLKDNDDDY